jgi:hypothetical protein
MSATDPDLTIFSDASLSGWGAVMNEVSSKGPWTLGDKNRHINELELLAALNGLKCFTSQVSNLSVRLDLNQRHIGGHCRLVRKAPTLDRSNTPTRGSECSCRSAIENAERIQRLETTGIDVPADSGPLGARDRPIRLDMESTIEPVCQLEFSAGSNGSRRFFPEVDQSEGIRISPIQYDRQMSNKDHKRRARINSGGTGLASATVVVMEIALQPPE